MLMLASVQPVLGIELLLADLEVDTERDFPRDVPKGRASIIMEG
jgi:hypothetical protein